MKLGIYIKVVGTSAHPPLWGPGGTWRKGEKEREREAEREGKRERICFRMQINPLWGEAGKRFYFTIL